MPFASRPAHVLMSPPRPPWQKRDDPASFHAEKTATQLRKSEPSAQCLLARRDRLSHPSPLVGGPGPFSFGEWKAPILSPLHQVCKPVPFQFGGLDEPGQQRPSGEDRGWGEEERLLVSDGERNWDSIKPKSCQLIGSF